jgi:hypothetical protein
MFVTDNNGKVGWGIDSNGWHVDIYEATSDGLVMVNGKYSPSQLRRRIGSGIIVIQCCENWRDVV